MTRCQYTARLEPAKIIYMDKDEKINLCLHHHKLVSNTLETGTAKDCFVIKRKIMVRI